MFKKVRALTTKFAVFSWQFAARQEKIVCSRQYAVITTKKLLIPTKKAYGGQ
jgi:hypothetical protein